MSEQMTRGTPLMVIQGASLRHDTGAVARSATLPCKLDSAAESPVMVNPELFSGLMKMGIKSLKGHNNALTVHTQSGLKARIPVVHDPHRNMQLSIGKDGIEVQPGLFQSWLDAALLIARGTSEAMTYTYRSTTFAFNRHVMIAARLAKGWPLPSITSSKHLQPIQQSIAGHEIAEVSCTSSEILVKTTSAHAVRVESAEMTMPEQPIGMIAQYKPHTLPPLLSVDASLLMDAIQQVVVVAQANRVNDTHVVELVPHKGYLVIRSTWTQVHIEGVAWPFGTVKVPFKGFASLIALAGKFDLVEVVSVPTPERPSDVLIIRAGVFSFFLASSLETTK